MGMLELINIELNHEAKTSVLSFPSTKELSAHLGGYGQEVLWIFDSNTVKLFRQLPTARVIIESGERSKNIHSLQRILEAAMEEELACDGRIIAFGGGVVCDLATLAASLYMRGCHLTLVPTTLLAMVDASLGGKGAIDFGGIKNIVGSFYPADEVLLSFDLLRTLNEREYKSGLAEVLKHALLSKDLELYKLLLSRRTEILDREEKTLAIMVELSLKIKQKYIEQDPREFKQIRQALNLGHTFGHALESSTRFATWSHGEAIAWGTCRALQAGVDLGITDKKFANSATKLFLSYGYELDFRIGRGEWLEFKSHLAKDKKKRKGEILFVLLKDQGSIELKTLEMPVIQALVMEKAIGRV